MMENIRDKYYTERELDPLKAYKGNCNFFDGEAIVYGKTAGKARYKMYLDVLDVCDTVKIMDINIVRAPEFDEIRPRRNSNFNCWDPSHLLKYGERI